MGDRTKIQWTNATWSPVLGCSRVSPGCLNCYAVSMSHRLASIPQVSGTYHGLTMRHANGQLDWTGSVRCLPERLDIPLHWRTPRRIFVNSMSDTFHPDVPFDFISRMWSVMLACHRHTFQVLTKRPERMRDFVLCAEHEIAEKLLRKPENIWLGTSVENQAQADARIPLLLQTPAAVRFVSVEPLLEPVDLSQYGWLTGCDACCNGDRCPGPPECNRFDRRTCPVCHGTAKGNNIDWVIIGAESGPKARYCDPAWVRSLVAQCRAAGVACFVKQLHLPGDGGGFYLAHDPEEWPEDLRVREYPNTP